MPGRSFLRRLPAVSSPTQRLRSGRQRCIFHTQKGRDTFVSRSRGRVYLLVTSGFVLPYGALRLSEFCFLIKYKPSMPRYHESNRKKLLAGFNQNPVWAINVYEGKLCLELL